MKKKTYTGIFLILAAVFLAIWGVCNATSFVGVISAVLSVLTPIIAGGCVAFALNMPLRFLERMWIRFFGAKRPGLRRAVCIVLCIALVGLLLTLLVWAIVPQIVETVKLLISRLPSYISKIKEWYAVLAASLTRFSISLPALSLDGDAVSQTLKKFVFENGQDIFSVSIGVAMSAFSAILDTLLAFVIAIYVLARKERLGGQAKKLLCSMFSDKTVGCLVRFARLTEKTFANFITGQLIEAVILGSLCFVGMLIFGMPYAPLISVLIGVTALIPIFGAFIGIGIGAFFILMESPMKAFLFVVFIIVLQQLEGNLIYPRVVGNKVGLPGVWVLIAVTAGSALGIVGMLASVPIASVCYALLSEFAENRLKKKRVDVPSETQAEADTDTTDTDTNTDTDTDPEFETKKKRKTRKSK